MENIKFIKWLFEKAGEPFKLVVYPKCTQVTFPSKEHAVFIEEFEKYCPDYAMSYLLQSAIDGVNKENGDYVIQQGNFGVMVISFCENQEFPEFSEISDESKRSALEYIFNQQIGGES